MRLRRLFPVAIALVLEGYSPAWAQTPNDTPHTSLPWGDAGAYRHWVQCQLRNVWPVPGLVATPEVVTVGSVSLHILHDPTDHKYQLKRNAIIAAITRLINQGFLFPPRININLVKGLLNNNDNVAGLCLSDGVPNVFLTKKCGVNTSKPAKSVASQYAKWTRKQIQEVQSAEEPADCNTYATRRGREAHCEANSVHELCHVLHLAQYPEEFVWSSGYQNSTSNHGGWVPVAGNVSNYATEKRLEFVAEVCAGLALGYEYDSGVMSAYEAMGGPKPGVPPRPLPCWDCEVQ